LEAAGKLFHAIADKFAELDLSKFQVRTFKGGKNSHQLTLTSVTVAIPEPDDQTAILQSRQPVYIYTSSKDASIVKWDFYSGRKMKFMPGGLKPTKKAKAMVGEKKLKEHQGHNDHILSIAASSNGKYLVS
jgi:ribosomal RNA-processing protein 9